MRVKKLKINRYKSVIEPIVINKFSNLHILVGPNNAGKTNILDALNLFFDKKTIPERFQDENTDIDLFLDFEEKEYFFKYKKDRISGYEEKIFLMQKSFVRIRDNDSIYDLIPQEIEKFKRDHPQDYQSFSLSLRKYFKDIEISEKLFVSSVYSDQEERPIKRMGSGFKRLFVILFYIFHPQYKIILIDEPELHLHPSIIRKFLFVLAEKKLNNQIFLTTHHPTFIQADYLECVWRVARNENKSTSIYSLIDSKINLSRFAQEINDDNSGMFFCDKVLLVEGVSDYIFMREILKKFYKKEKDVKVVYTGGKGTVDLYSNLCDQFKIPYAVMLDNDALKSHSLTKIKKYPFFKKNISNDEKIEILKEKEIFILDKSLESVYPSNCGRKETKPLTALFASERITEKDFKNKRMHIINEILEKI